jgi:chemosensory pili system protein ChpA (sensor histidine kinase/response regulator)
MYRFANKKRLDMARTILLADDDDDLRDQTASFLRDEGYRVITARDGVEAIEVLASGPVDFLLLDMKMPRADGLAVLRYLRTNRQLARVPVIVLTAAPAQVPAGVRAMGKPVPFDQLLLAVEVGLAQPRETAAPAARAAPGPAR